MSWTLQKMGTFFIYVLDLFDGLYNILGTCLFSNFLQLEALSPIRNVTWIALNTHYNQSLVAQIQHKCREKKYWRFLFLHLVPLQHCDRDEIILYIIMHKRKHLKVVLVWNLENQKVWPLLIQTPIMGLKYCTLQMFKESMKKFCKLRMLSKI